MILPLFEEGKKTFKQALLHLAYLTLHLIELTFLWSFLHRFTTGSMRTEIAYVLSTTASSTLSSNRHSDSK